MNEPLTIAMAEEILVEQGYAIATPEMDIGKVLLFSAFIGEDEIQLAVAAGYSLEKVRNIFSCLQKGGVFGANINHHTDYFDSENGAITLCMDVEWTCGHYDRAEQNLRLPVWVSARQYLDADHPAHGSHGTAAHLRGLPRLWT